MNSCHIAPPDYAFTKAAHARASAIRREADSVPRSILRAVIAVTGIPSTAIHNRRGTSAASKARQIAYYLIRQKSALSYPEIGRRMDRNHVAVLAGCRRVERVIEYLGIEKSDDPVEMCARLWSVVWPGVTR